MLTLKTKTKKIADLKKIMDFQNFIKKQICLRFDHQLTFPGVMRGPTQNVGPISSAVCWIQCKNRQKDRRTSKVYKYTYR